MNCLTFIGPGCHSCPLMVITRHSSTKRCSIKSWFIDIVLSTQRHIGNPRRTVKSVNRAIALFLCWFFGRGAAKQPCGNFISIPGGNIAACMGAPSSNTAEFRFEGMESTNTITGSLEEGPVCTCTHVF